MNEANVTSQNVVAKTTPKAPSIMTPDVAAAEAEVARLKACMTEAKATLAALKTSSSRRSKMLGEVVARKVAEDASALDVLRGWMTPEERASYDAL